MPLPARQLATVFVAGAAAMSLGSFLGCKRPASDSAYTTGTVSESKTARLSHNPGSNSPAGSSSTHSLDLGVLFTGQSSYRCWSFEELGLQESDEIRRLTSTCECIQPSVVTYQAMQGQAQALRVDFVSEPQTDLLISSFNRQPKAYARWRTSGNVYAFGWQLNDRSGKSIIQHVQTQNTSLDKSAALENRLHQTIRPARLAVGVTLMLADGSQREYRLRFLETAPLMQPSASSDQHDATHAAIRRGANGGRGDHL